MKLWQPVQLHRSGRLHRLQRGRPRHDGQRIHRRRSGGLEQRRLQEKEEEVEGAAQGILRQEGRKSQNVYRLYLSLKIKDT